MIFGYVIFLLYASIAAFALWLASRFVEAFASIARSLEDIAATYRRSAEKPHEN
jgi:hypothetical protein